MDQSGDELDRVEASADPRSRLDPLDGKAPLLNKEPLVYEEVKMSTRSYK